VPNDGAEPPLRVAFADIVNPGWPAGAHYYMNLLGALRQLDENRQPYVLVVVPPHKWTGGYDTYRELADEVVKAPTGSDSGFVVRQVQRARRRLGIDTRPGRPVERLLREHRIDAMFACWREFGPSFAVPLLGWIPDFQHKLYPELFSSRENRQRDRLFERMAANCSRVVLSSYDAKRDFEQFSSSYAHKARVLRFVAQVPADVYAGDPGRMCDEYQLPERFVYLPNQFWGHKNHGLVVEALARLKSRRPEITVVCTGNPSDNRNPVHFGELLARVSRLGVRDNFVVLGWVPHAHTFDLLRQSVAVVHPSLFEGWSTTVEETKSIGKTIVLSDIPIHREQAPPNALYFDPRDAAALAERLIEVYDTRSPGPDEALEARARELLPARVREYAETFIDIARDAMVSRSA
jgi:glycosyltransferase involved in cell wall biosynthesis